MLHNKKMLFPLLFFFSFFTVFSTSANAVVITSIKPLGFIASAIADGVIPVEVLLPNGASEHNYTLRPSDIKRLQEADLVVWVGSDMEDFISKTISTLPIKKSLELISLSTIKPLLITGFEEKDRNIKDNNINHRSAMRHHHRWQYNAHLWMSPEIARQSAIAFHEKLFNLLLHSKDKLDANLKQFELELTKSDKQIAHQLASFKGKRYFVFHDAYTYFEKHYGLTPLGYFTINPEIQPSMHRLYQIRSQLEKQKATCVFVEPQFKSTIIDAISKGKQVRKGILDPLGVDISLGKDSYMQFLSQLSSQYISCLKGV